MNNKRRDTRPRRWWLAAAAFGATLALAPPAYAGGPGEAAASLMGLVAVVILLLAMGLAVGSFSMTVNHIFRKRSTVSFKVLCARPGWSLLAGVVVTLLGLGLLALLHAAKPLQLLVMVAYLVGLVLFAIAVAVRFAGRVIDPTTLDDEVPDARLLLKGGLLLLAVNVVPIIGTMLCAGIVLAAVGATLLGYFTRLAAKTQPAVAGAAAAPAAAAPPPPPVAPTTPGAPATRAGEEPAAPTPSAGDATPG